MVNDFRKNKSNIKRFNRSSSWIYFSSVFTKKNLCCERNLLCFVSFYLPRSCLMLVSYNKTNIPSFLFNIEIIRPQLYHIQFRFASLNINYLRWIISDIKQKKPWNILLIISLLLALLPWFDKKFFVLKINKM